MAAVIGSARQHGHKSHARIPAPPCSGVWGCRSSFRRANRMNWIDTKASARPKGITPSQLRFMVLWCLHATNSTCGESAVLLSKRYLRSSCTLTITLSSTWPILMTISQSCLSNFVSGAIHTFLPLYSAFAILQIRSDPSTESPSLTRRLLILPE